MPVGIRWPGRVSEAVSIADDTAIAREGETKADSSIVSRCRFRAGISDGSLQPPPGPMAARQERGMVGCRSLRTILNSSVSPVRTAGKAIGRIGLHASAGRSGLALCAGA